MKTIEDEATRQQYGYTPYLPPTFKFQLDYDDFEEMMKTPREQKEPTWQQQKDSSNFRGGRGGRGARGGRGGARGGGYLGETRDEGFSLGSFKRADVEGENKQ